jgi:lactate permease
MATLSAWVGRICAPVALLIPSYLILVMGGWANLKAVFPATLVCGVSFAAVQFVVSNYLGAQLTDILSSLAAIASLITLLQLWKPKAQSGFDVGSVPLPSQRHKFSQIIAAWLPYFLLVSLVFLWGLDDVKKPLERLTVKFPWPGLHNTIERVAPLTPQPTAYPAEYSLNFMTASGTACMIAVLLAAAVLRVRLRQLGAVAGASAKQLAFPFLTIAAVLGLAFLMNYSGATTTLGLAFAATGRAFPFFSPLLGWLGVFLVGSDTAANALFGNLQAVTAGHLGFDPALMAAANSCGGVMGKMISLSSIAVAAGATGLPSSDEAKLFRFTLKHSLVLVCAIAWLTLAYAHL